MIERVIEPRPVVVPIWFSNLQNLVVKRGGDDLVYHLGDIVNVYGDEMKVEVDFGDLSNATYFKSETNEIIVDQLRLPRNDSGY